MSQILYVPCKRHGDVYVASVTCKKFSLSVQMAVKTSVQHFYHKYCVLC
jgi:hypothetical protein